MIELAPIALGIICAVAFFIYAGRGIAQILVERKDERLKQHLSWNGTAHRVSRVAAAARPVNRRD